jgi:hypothetical protein
MGKDFLVIQVEKDRRDLESPRTYIEKTKKVQVDLDRRDLGELGI